MYAHKVSRLSALTVAGLAAISMTAAITGSDSFWAPHVQRAFEPWMTSGISEAAVAQAATARCWQNYGQYFDLFRFKILEGQLYVHFAKTLASQMEDHDHRALFAVAMLLEVLQEFPGQIADTDAVFHTTDWPCHAQQQSSADTLPPILGYSTTDTHVDIPMPDFTELSHFGGVTNDPKTGKPRIGWEQQLEVFQTFEPKTQQLFWRGRHDRKEARDYLRNELIDCPKVLSADTQHDLVSMLNLDGAAVSVYDRCQYQYLAYVESKAYSASLKHMLACGSVVLSLPLQYHHYYAQALAPDEHLVHVQRFNNSLCLGIVQVLRELQADPQRVERIGKNALQFVQDHLTVSSRQRYVRDVLNQWAALQLFVPSLPATWECQLSPPLSQMFSHDIGDTYFWAKRVRFFNCTSLL